MSNIKFCSKCRSNNSSDLFSSGYYNWLKEDCYECPAKDCGNRLIDINLSKDDFDIITSISRDVIFLEQMIQLKENDIIEYNLKMSQFKANLGQQESSKIQTDTHPKCPTCGSTNLRKVSATSKVTSVALWGLFSQKVKKTWHCNECGYEW